VYTKSIYPIYKPCVLPPKIHSFFSTKISVAIHNHCVQLCFISLCNFLRYLVHLLEKYCFFCLFHMLMKKVRCEYKNLYLPCNTMFTPERMEILAQRFAGREQTTVAYDDDLNYAIDLGVTNKEPMAPGNCCDNYRCHMVLWAFSR